MLFFKKKESPVLRKKVPTKRLSPLQVQLVVGIVIAIVIALLVTTIWYVTRIASLQIENVEVIGGETIPHSVIENIVKTQLTGTYLKLVPKKFSPFYPKQAIIENIKSIDRVKNVDVQTSKDQTVTVVFDEYIPYALWCQDSESLSCFFIDATGFAFAEAPELEGNAFVRYTEEGVVPKNKSNSFERSYIEETEVFIELLKEKLSLYVTHVSKHGTYDIEYKIGGGGIIKVSQRISMEDTFANLETILRSKEFEHIEPGAFAYIDLRFGDKVFVNEALEPIASTTASTSNTF